MIASISLILHLVWMDNICKIGLKYYFNLIY